MPSKSPEVNDRMVSPKLGKRCAGMATAIPLIWVSSNRRAVSKWTSFWNIRVTPAGFQSMPKGSFAVATCALPRPDVRALV